METIQLINAQQTARVHTMVIQLKEYVSSIAAKVFSLILWAQDSVFLFAPALNFHKIRQMTVSQLA
jgi:hypothetical protein